MRLPEPGAAVDEEWVVRLGRRLGDCECGGVREAVRRADDERVERVLRVESTALGSSLRALDHGNNALRPCGALRRAFCGAGDLELDRPFDSDDVAHRRADQSEE